VYFTITKYKLKRILIIKIGGNVIDEEPALERFLSDFAQLDHPKILVHGGGKKATTLCRQLGIEPVMIDGRRVTDRPTLDVVTMVYAGLINKTIVAKLQAYHCNALGISGADGNAIESHKRMNTSVDYGFAGDIDQVNASLLLNLLKQDMTPVIAPVTHDRKGMLLNTNADTIAAEVAMRLAEFFNVSLIFCFEKKGLLKNMDDESSVMHDVRQHEIHQLVEKQIITGGMLPKIQNINKALDKSVEKVILCHASELLSIVDGNAKFGTIFTKQ
jgi:acetylglutamate kinase